MCACLDIIQTCLNLWLMPRTADEYSHGYSHIVSYFESFRDEKKMRAAMKNNLFFINIGLISIKSFIILGKQYI